MDLEDFADMFTSQISAHIDEIEQDIANIPVVARLSEIPAQNLAWLWRGWIPAGVLTILGGHVGDGKSTVITALVAALTSGSALPDGTTAVPTNVLILAAEDDPARVIRPRLDANHVDPDRVFILDAASLDLGHGIDHLRRIIEDNHIGLVIIDPLSSLLRRADRGGESEIRAALRPLAYLAASTGVALLGTMRVGKTGRTRRPAQRLVGTSAVPAIARSVIMIAREEDDQNPDRAILQVVKSNYAAAPEPVALRIDPDGAVHWLGPTESGIDDRADDAMDRRLSRSERTDAADFLREYLHDHDVEGTQVLKQAKRLGFSEITIRRAKKDIGVTSYRDGFYGTTWKWRLPADDQDDHLHREK